jgi:hypothetical protein
MRATCFGLYLDHPQACQYKNLTNEDIRPTKIVQRKMQNQHKSYKGRFKTNRNLTKEDTKPTKILKGKIQSQQKSYKGRYKTNKNLINEGLPS